MSQIIRLTDDKSHECSPPTGPVSPNGEWYNPFSPSLPDGSIWRCNCGRFWLAKDHQWWSYKEMSILDKIKVKRAYNLYKKSQRGEE